MSKISHMSQTQSSTVFRARSIFRRVLSPNSLNRSAMFPVAHSFGMFDLAKVTASPWTSWHSHDSPSAFRAMSDLPHAEEHENEDGYHRYRYRCGRRSENLDVPGGQDDSERHQHQHDGQYERRYDQGAFHHAPPSLATFKYSRIGGWTPLKV
jgi:hypothetical protein